MKTKRFVSLFLSLLLAVSCAVPALAAGQQYLSVYSSYKIPSGSVRMTAHRGYSAVAPENTLPAFRQAGEYGFWGAECDICNTADGEWVIMHDDTVDRMTDGSGKVNEMTFAEIRALTIDAGNNAEQYPGTQVPTLTEYLDVCKEYGMRAVIEIKGNADYALLDGLADLLSAREEKDHFVIITFAASFAARMKELLPDTPVYLLIGGATEQAFLDGILFCLDHHLDGIDFACVWGEDIVKRVQSFGLKTMVWTVDDVETVERYYQWGVRDFTTNALTPAEPQRNVFQRLIRKLLDLFRAFAKAFETRAEAPRTIC